MAADAYLNNDISALVKAAYAQLVGADDIDTLDLADFCETGKAYDNLIANNAWKEQFTKALLQQCVKNFYTDTSYREEYRDPFYKESRRFGSIVQAISAEIPDSAIVENKAWQVFTSGTSTAGVYTLIMPSVSAKFYGKTSSWELDVTITGEQWDTAFKNESELESFVAYIMMVVDNAIVCHLEECNNMNRNNFIAEKINYASGQSATGVHVIDLLALYRAETGDETITTVEGFMADDKCMRFAAETMDKFTGYLSRMSVLFNVDGKKKFTPKSRQVFQILQHFYSRMKSVSYADAFNLDFVKLPGFDTVPYWQGFGEASATTGSVDFDEVSAIKVKTADGNTVSQTGVVGFLCDEWAIMHTIISERVAHVRFDPENADEFFYQFRDQRINNLGMPAVVFVINDVT